MLSNQLIGEKLPNEIEQILKDYDKTLSDISKDFLKSSGLIYKYYKKKNYKYFDYSMPASGLWKLVERELNTSFVWYVRIQKRVCDSTCPWTSLFTRKDKITHEIEKGKIVKLNQFHYTKDELQGVMLGGINLLLKDNDILNYFNTFINIDDYITSDIIKNISTIRNENAHIKAMSLEKFEELYKLLFKDGNINKLLEMKGIIRNKIESL